MAALVPAIHVFRLESKQDVDARHIGVLKERRSFERLWPDMTKNNYTPAHMRPGLSTPLGSKLSFTRRLSADSAGSSG